MGYVNFVTFSEEPKREMIAECLSELVKGIPEDMEPDWNTFSTYYGQRMGHSGFWVFGIRTEASRKEAENGRAV